MNRLAPLLGAALAITLAGSASAEEGVTATPPPSITAEGSASATLAPDMALLSLGVVTTRQTATDAVSANGAAVGRALATLKAEGVAGDAVTTSALDLSAVMDEPKTGTPAIVGYQARSELEVRVPTSQDVGKVVSSVVDEGVNAIDGLSFASSREAAERDRLKGEAAKAARREAEIYAGALGLRLGRVLRIVPGTARVPALPMHAAMASRAASVPIPVEPGRLDVTERVSVTFELTP